MNMYILAITSAVLSCFGDFGSKLPYQPKQPKDLFCHFQQFGIPGVTLIIPHAGGLDIECTVYNGCLLVMTLVT